MPTPRQEEEGEECPATGSSSSSTILADESTYASSDSLDRMLEESRPSLETEEPVSLLPPFSRIEEEEADPKGEAFS